MQTASHGTTGARPCSSSPCILLANCKQYDWAELAGPAFKSAITRHAARFFEHMANKYLLGDSAVYRHVRLLTTSLVAFYNCLYTAGMFLAAEDAATLQRHTLAFGTNYQRLRNMAASKGHWCASKRCTHAT